MVRVQEQATTRTPATPSLLFIHYQFDRSLPQRPITFWGPRERPLINARTGNLSAPDAGSVRQTRGDSAPRRVQIIPLSRADRMLHKAPAERPVQASPNASHPASRPAYGARRRGAARFQRPRRRPRSSSSSSPPSSSFSSSSSSPPLSLTRPRPPSPALARTAISHHSTPWPDFSHAIIPRRSRAQ